MQVATLDGAREGARPPAFGARLRAYRVAAGLTQEALAERAGLGVRGLKYLEQGARHPYPDTLRRLADALALAAGERAAFLAAGRGDGATGIARDMGMPPAFADGGALPLVGRVVERALLERHLAGAGPPLLLLAGEPGIGKSRLLQEAILPATRGGWRVLAGGCQRRGGHQPYAPLLGALRHYLERQPAGRLRADLRGCAWLVRLLPELADSPIPPLPPWTLAPEQERRLMVAAVTRFLANVAGPGGTLLLLDDLQWADPDALDLLATLARSAQEIPLRVIGAYRDTEVQPSDPLAVTLADLSHAGLAARRLLHPLAPEEEAQLLDQLLDDSGDAGPALRAEVLRRAGGVPFFVVSWAQGLRQDKVDRGGTSLAVGGSAVPWDVAQSVRQRVAALPAAACEMVGAAAVVGRVVAHTLLVSVTGLPEAELFAALGVACRAGLLVEDDQTYQFTHDVIREVIEHDVGLAQRTALHRRVAEALEQQPGVPPVELLAYHYSRGGEQDEALLYMEQAGDRAAAHHAHAAAQDYYRQAMNVLDQLGRPWEGARICEKLGLVLRSMGRYEQALEMLERAVATHRAARDLEAEGRVTASIGQVHFEAGTWEEGIARVRPLLAPLEARGPSPALAALYVAFIPLFAPTGRYREYQAVAERASALARSLGDNWLLADSEAWRGVALAELERNVDARPVLEGAISLAEAAHHLRSLGRTLAFLGRTYLADGAFTRAREMYEQALDTSERLGDPNFTGWTTCRLADVHALAGTWTQARTLYERAIAIFRSLGGATRFSPIAFVGLGALSLDEGNWEEASRYLEEGAAVAARIRHLGALRVAQQALAERDLLVDQPQAALVRLQTLLKDLDLEDSILTAPMPALAQAYLALGDLAHAEVLVAAGVTRARDRCNCVGLAEWLCLQGAVWISQGRCQDAQRALDEAIALAHCMPYPYVEARLLRLYGAMHMQMGEPELARGRLEAALAIFQRLGARRDVEHTQQALGTLHVAQPGPARAPSAPGPPEW